MRCVDGRECPEAPDGISGRPSRTSPDLAEAVEVHNLYLRTDLGPLDILGSIRGVGDFERIRQHAVEVELFGRSCRVISLDDLIRAKEAVGRDKDLLTVKELLAIREKMK